MKLAYDLSSFIWHNLLAGKDKENGTEVYFEDSHVWINSAGYGYDRVISQMLKVMEVYDVVPNDVILVAEGLNSKSRRVLISNTYKSRRKERPPEYYVVFEELREMLERTWLELGATVMVQDYAEGDDTLAWLAENMEEDLVVATYDNDLAVLNGVNSHGAEIESWIDGLTGVNKFGTFDHHLIPTYKALVGDTTDNITGCPGFGPATFVKFLEKYDFDGLEQVQAELEKGGLGWLHENAEDCKILKKICDNEKAVVTSYELAKLRPEWVNTMKSPLRIKAGMVRQLHPEVDLRLKQWYGRSRLITAENFEEAVAWALPLINNSPFVALDIETSTGEESDEWLAAKGKPDGVDVFGSKLTGLGLTFGGNNQYSFYFSVDHAETNNIPKNLLRDFIEQIKVTIVTYNMNFELSVLFQEWGEAWKDNGYFGFLPKVVDAMFFASYTDENLKLGLKFRSLHHLGYKQTEYSEVTTLEGPINTLRKGGRLVREWVDDATQVTYQSRKYKMNELPAKHVLGYGLDDTICTAALHNYFKLVMQLEHTYQVCLKVEIEAAYANASAFLNGIGFSMEKMLENEKRDEAELAKAKPLLMDFLIAQGWEGTVCPTYTSDITPAQIKEAYAIVVGEPLDTAMRTLTKIVKFIEVEKEQVNLAGALQRLLDGDPELFNKMVAKKFSGYPDFNADSPKQLQVLLYDCLKLPVRLRNKVTDTARAKGERQGSPKCDDLAIQHALHFDATPENEEILKAIQTIKTCGTRSKLFYMPYRNFPHWKDGLLHPSTNQCATVTRRNSASDPNYTQWPSKGEGIKFRECIVACAPGRVILSADSSGQELRLAADLSKDENMLSCYIGKNKRDIHSIVSAAASKYFWDREWSYEEFYAALKGEDEALAETCDALRGKSKTVNFGEIYGTQAQSMGNRLMISEEEAQKFLDAKKAMFPGVEIWKSEVIARGRRVGYSQTMLGARRHLAEIFKTGDKWGVSKAERQLPNAEIQGSGAEAVKIALGRLFFSGVLQRCDAYILGSIHDELVVDSPADKAYEVLAEMRRVMSAPYANMIVPFESSATIGVNFGKQLSLPVDFTEADVNKRLKELGLCKETA